MGTLQGSKTEENLKAAFAGESQANRRYLYFAAKADVEGQNDVAAIFRSVLYPCALIYGITFWCSACPRSIHVLKIFQESIKNLLKIDCKPLKKIYKFIIIL